MQDTSARLQLPVKAQLQPTLPIMAPSEISAPKLLTAARGSTFILVSALIFKFTYTVLIILPILAMIELGIEHLLGMVQLVYTQHARLSYGFVST
jgi:hypothetical protein